VFDDWDIAGVTSFISGAPLGIGYSMVVRRPRRGRRRRRGQPRAPDRQPECCPRASAPSTATSTPSVVRPPTRAEFGIGNAPKTPSAVPAPTCGIVSIYKNIPLGAERPPPAVPLRVLQLLQPRQLPGRGHHRPIRRRRQRQVSGTFGQYTSTLDARRIVLGAKFYF
jgi:hypothetical protein